MIPGCGYAQMHTKKFTCMSTRAHARFPHLHASESGADSGSQPGSQLDLLVSLDPNQDLCAPS
eukprot:1928730-Karenia_brevis.AAC.1